MNVVMIHSYKGGSGKTLFSLNSASILHSKFSKRVLLIEADFSMPVFHNILKDQKPDIFFNDYLNQANTNLSDCIYPNAKSDLGVIYCNPEFSPSDSVLTTNHEWFEKTLIRIKQDINKLNYDFIIFDLSPGKNLFAASILLLSDVIFSIIRPDTYSMDGLKGLFYDFYSSVSRLQNKKFHVILNQVPKHKEMGKIMSEWEHVISNLSTNIQSLDLIDFEHETGYEVASNNLLLPDNNLTKAKFEEILKNSFIQ